MKSTILYVFGTSKNDNLKNHLPKKVQSFFSKNILNTRFSIVWTNFLPKRSSDWLYSPYGRFVIGYKRILSSMVDI